MDMEQLVGRARHGDVKAFVELTRRFQHLAFGAALALVHDLQQAEDIVQEAFLAAWSALPKQSAPLGRYRESSEAVQPPMRPPTLNISGAPLD